MPSPRSPPPASPAPTPGDLTVGPGTLYLGGERLDLDAAVDLADQPDWLDQADRHPLGGPGAPPARRCRSPDELVYLLAIEQEVSAVEDPALSDVALGGPDTMQRLRILQHFVRWPTQAADCAAAWAEVEAAWATIGLTSTPRACGWTPPRRCRSASSPIPRPPARANRWRPAATSGPRTSSSGCRSRSVNPAGVPTIVWGYDDATFLYQVVRAAPDGSGNLVLTLAEPPVDSYPLPAGRARRSSCSATRAILTPGRGGLRLHLRLHRRCLRHRHPAHAGLRSRPPGPWRSRARCRRSIPVLGQLYLRVWQGADRPQPEPRSSSPRWAPRPASR